MKKLVFIFSLILSLLLGGMSGEAKTSSNRQHAKTHQSSQKSQNTNSPKEFGPSVFFNKEGCYKKNSIQSLTSLGFKKQSKTKWVKDGFIVNQDEFGDYTIIFPSKEALDKFINEMKEIYGEDAEAFDRFCGIQCLIEDLEIIFQALP